MSYCRISETQPKARKSYPCIWCRERILQGEKHLHRVGSFYGEFQDDRYHLECVEATERYFKESGEDEFEPHSYQRGSTQEA